MADAREIAYGITRRVNSEGAYLNLMLRYGMGRGDLDARDRSLVAELAYGLQRHRNKLDFIIAAFSRRTLTELDPEVLDILRFGVYQLSEMRIPQHAAVNESVGLAKRLLGRGASSYVNAVMRRASAGLEGLQWPSREQLPLYLEIIYSHPRWLVDYMLQCPGPSQAEALCAANNEIPELTLRVNTATSDTASLMSEIISGGGSASPSACLNEALRGVRLPYYLLLDMIDSGRCVVQDESSMLVSHVLGPSPGDVIIDACAAPGGKATHLATLGGESCRIIAVDRNARRLDALRDAVSRLGLGNVHIRQGDSTRLGECVEEEADAVLVDAPCSGLGTLRRNPELKWRRQPGDLVALSGLQRDLLLGCAEKVRAGGVMVYSVCTHTREETVDVLDAFLAARRDFHLTGQVQVWPHLFHLEGMFIARMVRA
jgi:16S rRNA (cytosine967-C5)-methyltransferase